MTSPEIPVLGHATRSMMLMLLAQQLDYIAEWDPSNPHAQPAEDGPDESQRYGARNVAVMMAVASAAAIGYPAGYRIDESQPDWPVAYIDLPSGQVSWHLPQYPGAYDLHSTADKYARIRVFLAEWAML